jgi:hypothetical protein
MKKITTMKERKSKEQYEGGREAPIIKNRKVSIKE